jgi:predicted ATPase
MTLPWVRVLRKERGVADVFISYSREDAAEAERLAGALEAAGYTCWWDRNLTPGTRYLAETEAQLKAARAVVVIWSRISITSHWVADEAAVGRDDNRLVALSFDGSMPPLGFRQFQVADLSGWQGRAEEASFRNLLAGLERLAPRGVVAGPVAAVPAPPTRGNLPRRLEPLIGREAELSQIGALLAEASLVTLTGPGGIGKTRLAIEVARQAAGAHADGAWIAELASLTDPAAIPAAIARSMGIELRDDPAGEIVERLRSWRALIVLDNCEHLIEAAAALVEHILQQAPDVRFLVTSQEILGLEGERVVRLRSLGEAEAQELFVRRARGADPSFARSPANEDAIREICARLDGIALAIEMAGARAPALGCGALLALLNDRFRALSGGRRTALPRQRTLQATLDWSHSLLKPEEAAVFRRLAVFAGGFSLEAACAVASDGAVSRHAVSEVMASLSAKSLVLVEPRGGEARYRLLETMRIYAQQKLLEAGETTLLQRRHAEYYTALVEPALETLLSASSRAQMARFESYVGEVNNVESALDWAFGPEGDVSLGVVLVAHGAYLVLMNSRPSEALNWLQQASRHTDHAPAFLRQRIIAQRLDVEITFSVDFDLLMSALTDVPEGSDRTARTLVLWAAGNAAARLGRSDLFERILPDALALNWPQGSNAALRFDLMRLLRDVSFLPAADPGLRERSDAIARTADASGMRGAFYAVHALGNCSRTPWQEDPDKAIAHARDMIAATGQDSGWDIAWPGLSALTARLVVALCERASPGDVEEARARLAALIGCSGGRTMMQRRALCWLAMTQDAFTGGRVLGWALASFGHASGSQVARDFYWGPLYERLRGQLQQSDFDRALREGAKLTHQQAVDLAIGSSREAPPR